MRHGINAGVSEPRTNADIAQHWTRFKHLAGGVSSVFIRTAAKAPSPRRDFEDRHAQLICSGLHSNRRSTGKAHAKRSSGTTGEGSGTDAPWTVNTASFWPGRRIEACKPSSVNEPGSK